MRQDVEFHGFGKPLKPFLSYSHRDDVDRFQFQESHHLMGHEDHGLIEVRETPLAVFSAEEMVEEPPAIEGWGATPGLPAASSCWIVPDSPGARRCGSMFQMSIHEYLDEFGGRAVRAWEPGQFDPQCTGFRIGVTWDECEAAPKRANSGATSDPWIEKFAVNPWIEKLAAFLASPEASRTETLVVGTWCQPGDDSTEIVAAIAAAKDRLPNLKAAFLGDILQEENEISWINHQAVTPILEAFPELEVFGVRGGSGLGWAPVHHDHLKHLVIQTGGLDVSVVRGVLASSLPALEHLELWLGDDDYGGNVKPIDLAPLLNGRLFPKLRYLGLCDSDIQDDIAIAVAASPIAGMVKVLDLSKGTLTAKGGKALLGCRVLRNLERLDLHHHFLPDEMVEELQKVFGDRVDLSDQQSEEDDYRFVAVSE